MRTHGNIPLHHPSCQLGEDSLQYHQPTSRGWRDSASEEHKLQMTSNTLSFNHRTECVCEYI